MYIRKKKAPLVQGLNLGQDLEWEKLWKMRISMKEVDQIAEVNFEKKLLNVIVSCIVYSNL